jgi:stage II sporulation protein AA (anti-sigma F factor antagonist)
LHEFEQALESGSGKDPPMLIADLTGASYLDSSGLSALLHAHKAISARGGLLCVVASPDSPGVKRVLEITRLDTVFRVRDELEDAVAELRPSGSVISSQ